jgi:hypothetical protein
MMSTRFYPADPITLSCFTALCAMIVVAFVTAVYVSARSQSRPTLKPTILAVAGMIVWVGGFSVLVGTRVINAGQPLTVVATFAALNVIVLTAALSPLGKGLAQHLPLTVLVGFQAFRLPLELILNEWAHNGTIPMSMTFHGQNWDIISGIVALVAAPFAERSRAIAWLANVVGIVLLINVGRVAILSSPVPFGWNVEPKLLLIFNLPYAWIAPVCVGAAVFGHVVLTRALILRSRTAG